MDATTISILAIILFLVVLFLGMHIGLAFMFAGFAGMVFWRGFDVAISSLAVTSWSSVSNFSFAVIPMFMLMGNFAIFGGITAELFDACYKWMGRFRGGLGFVAVATDSLFHCFCGSATAATATIGTVCYPEMVRYKYKSEVCSAIIASCSAFGLLIPPSLGLIIYSMNSSVSVGKMFAAGIVPSVIVIGLSFVLITVWARIKPEDMPIGGETFTMQEKLRSLKGLIGFVCLFVFMLWGILTGFFSPSEGGAIGAAGAFLIMLIRRKATRANIWICLRNSIKTTCMIFILIIGAKFFGTLLASLQMPAKLAATLSSMDASPYVVLWIIVIVYILLGMVMDTLPVIMILTPIFMPLVNIMKWAPIWFGIITVMCMLIGLITPPVGLPVYIMAGISKKPLTKIFKACMPFFVMLMVLMVLIIYIQPLTTWLPNLLSV